MNLFKFFRKPYLATFMATLLIFFSCEQYEEPTTIIDAQALKNTHSTIATDLNAAMLNSQQSGDFSGRVANDSEVEQAFLSNLNYVNENGLESLLISNGIDSEVLLEFDFYLANQGNENVYNMLINNFDFETQEEANFLFNLVEIHSMLDSELSESARIEISWGCALAIAGTVATTAGAAFITGGAALIVFLVAKGIATASIIEACT